ncbi:AAA-domain-containing protein [Piromyces finnis]|uniref:AAA-domain-containing protein n=1 Tax=Piromyces finnis TaxID=1754191 RepID=A0A1Y1VNB2_9FUNG|nr:AAA-domain-containing protein [Piromyces finnis]|eukprot:ORX60122.1 AAA-domain-containing protein [Piromyces finnis]
MSFEMFKFKAKSYTTDSSNILVNVNFIFDNKLKCLESIFIKPVKSNSSVEIQAILLPNLTVKEDDVLIPNWMLKYWKIDNEMNFTDFEVEIQIIKEDNIPFCDTITINNISKDIFFPNKIPNNEIDSYNDSIQLNNKTPLNSINYKQIIIRNSNNKIIKLNSAYEMFVSANPCLFKVIAINGDKINKTQLFKISENTKFSFEREVQKKNKHSWGLDNERKQLIDLLSYNEMESILQKQLNIQKCNGIIINGVIGVGKHEIVQDVCSTLDIPIYSLSILDMNMEYMNNEDNEMNSTERNDGQKYSYLNKVFDKAKLSAPSVILISELDLLANGNNDSEINKVLILKDLEKVIEEVKYDNSIHVIGLTENRKDLPEIFSKSQLFNNVINIDIPNRKEREIQLSYLLKDQLLDNSLLINEEENEENISIVEVYAKNLSELTPGYVRKNLQQLCNFARQHCLTRSNNESKSGTDNLIDMMSSLSIQNQKKQNYVLNYNDFLYALNQVKPSNTIDFETKREKTSWNEIGGYEKIVEKIKHLVKWPLLYPETYTKLGVKPPSGLILYGPSGCGKTLMINALSSDYSINFVRVKGSEIMSKYLGESEHKIRKLFAQARKLNPCVLFFDELDSIGTKRNWSDDGTGGVDERVLSTMLNEMDGIQERQGIFIIGCTNRPDLIDDALLRPGRFDHLIYIDMPNVEDRLGILNTITQPYDEERMKIKSNKGINNKKAVIDPSINLSLLAQRTTNFTGADLVVLLR